MLSKGFNKEFFESVYKLNEDCGSGSGCGTSEPGPSCGGSGCGFKESINRLNECGGTGTGGCGANKASCGGGGGCGLTESLQKMNECGGSYSYDSTSIGGCGSLGYHHSCEVGRRVRIAVRTGCGEGVEVGRLLGYAD